MKIHLESSIEPLPDLELKTHAIRNKPGLSRGPHGLRKCFEGIPASSDASAQRFIASIRLLVLTEEGNIVGRMPFQLTGVRESGAMATSQMWDHASCEKHQPTCIRELSVLRQRRVFEVVSSVVPGVFQQQTAQFYRCFQTFDEAVPDVREFNGCFQRDIGKMWLRDRTLCAFQ